MVTAELIEEVMGEPAVAQPIRTYVGFNSEPLYQTGDLQVLRELIEGHGGGGKIAITV